LKVVSSIVPQTITSAAATDEGPFENAKIAIPITIETENTDNIANLK
jgi:hypothetical protein